MSKERLEELAYNVGISLDGEKTIMSSDDYDFLYNYAKEQTERIQELERKIERYREALEFYADTDNYGSKSVDFPTVWFDEGEKARQALESDNE